VEAALKDIESEIIVVDNHSEDDSLEMVTTRFPQVTLIANQTNFGFSKGNNIGVEKAKGDYVCILNPDTVVAEDTFTSLLRVADTKANLGVMACRLIDGRGRFLPESKRHIPTPMVSFKKLFGKPDSYYFNELPAEASGSIEIAVGAFMLMKREGYWDVGGFDEDYFMYGEDIDLSYKFLKKGYDNYYVGTTSVVHFKGESTFKDAKYIQRFYGAMRIFYQKHFASNVLLNVLVNLGIKLARLKGPKKTQSKTHYKQVYLRSSLGEDHFSTQFKVPVLVVDSLNDSQPDSLLVFSAESMSFKSIIQFMQTHSDKNNFYYRIQPKNATFIIGSDSSFEQGDVIHFSPTT
jgi:GT2 family glycosyltransferase